jgi:hypothetical protein
LCFESLNPSRIFNNELALINERLSSYSGKIGQNDHLRSEEKDHPLAGAK